MLRRNVILAPLKTKKSNPKTQKAKPTKTPAPGSPLAGWAAIAKYLGQPITVAQRWAKDGMPVQRKGRSMTALPEELSGWLGKESGTRQPVHVAQSSDDDLLKELRRGLREARQLKR